MKPTSDVVRLSRLPSPRVPPELSDLIIDYLHHHKLSLKNCSLVCRTWLPATRYHLFSTVTLHFASEIMRLYNLIEDSQEVDTLPEPALYVRDLSVSFFRQSARRSGIPATGHTLSYESGPHYEPNYKPHVLYCLPHLSGVETLTLSHVDFPHISLDMRVALTTFSPVIRTLKIGSSLVGGPLYCEQLLKAFPTLRMIHVKNTTFIFGDTRENLTDDASGAYSHYRIRPDSGHVLEVSELTVDCRSSYTASVVCRVHSEKKAFLTQKEFHIPFPTRPVVEMRGANHLQLPGQIPAERNKTNMTGMHTLITGMLSQVDKSVEHLSLCFQYVDFASMNEQMAGFDLGISEMDNLASLCLGNAKDQDLRWILLVLKQVTSFKMKKLTIVLPTKPLKDISEEAPRLLQWRQLDEQLVRLRDASSYLEVVLKVKAQIRLGEGEADRAREVAELRSLGISMLPSSKSSGVRVTTSVTTYIPHGCYW